VPDVQALLARAQFGIEQVATAGRSFDQLDLLLYYVWRHLLGREGHPFESVRRNADREWTRNDGWNSVLVVALAHGKDVEEGLPSRQSHRKS
jgi:hypothetical protein